MDANKSIKTLKHHYAWLKQSWKPYPDQKVLDAIETAVSVLEKQIPKKPDRGYDENEFDVTYYPVCPRCKGEYTLCERWFKFCSLCGRAIYWRKNSEA